MSSPFIQILVSAPTITDWISAIGTIFASGAAIFAICVARTDLRATKKQLQAQTTYQIHKDILDFVNARNGKSTPEEKLLFYYSMFNLIEANLLHPGLKTMVQQDLKAANAQSEFKTFWLDKNIREKYPMDFQKFIAGTV